MKTFKASAPGQTIPVSGEIEKQMVEEGLMNDPQTICAGECITVTKAERDAAVAECGIPGPRHPIDRLHPANISGEATCGGVDAAATEGTVCCSRNLPPEEVSELRSPCCGATVRVCGNTTLYYVCDECKKACDPVNTYKLSEVPTTSDDKAKAALKRVEQRFVSPWNTPLPKELADLSLQPQIDRIVKGISLEGRKQRLLGVAEGLGLCYNQMKGKAQECFMNGDDKEAGEFRIAANSIKMMLNMNHQLIDEADKALDDHAKGKDTCD